MNVRPLSVSDLEAVAAVEAECFSRPWSEEALYRDYAQNPSSDFYVVEGDGEILGHVGLWRRQDHVHITTLAVRPSRRREGYGRALLEAVREDYPDQDVTLEVRESNESAQAFYRSAGFDVTGLRRDYYTDNGENALVMSLHAETAEPVADGRP